MTRRALVCQSYDLALFLACQCTVKTFLRESEQLPLVTLKDDDRIRQQEI